MLDSYFPAPSAFTKPALSLRTYPDHRSAPYGLEDAADPGCAGRAPLVYRSSAAPLSTPPQNGAPGVPSARFAAPRADYCAFLLFDVLNREIHAASPAAFLQMVRTKAEEAGSWYEEAPTQEIKPTQRCHAYWQLPDEKKRLSDRQHQCPHCGAACGRDENAARVLLRWLETRLAGESGSGREPSEVWSGGRFAAMKHETYAIAV